MFSRRRLIAIIFGVALLVLGLWYFLAGRRHYAVLYEDLRAPQAAAVVAALEADDVSYRLALGGRQILVPTEEADALRLRLSGGELPIAGVAGFELFNESDMGYTDFAQRIRYQRAIQGELARTIMMMEGVIEARVHISMPERTLFRSEARRAEAAVTLVMRSRDDETVERIEGVQRLVAASVPDLAAADVVVLNARGEVISSRVELVEVAPGSLETEAGSNAPSLDYVTEVLRRAIPHRRFEARIEQEAGALAGDVEPASETALVGRRFVVITTESSLGPEEREAVRSALFSTGLIEVHSSDLLRFETAPLAHLDAPAVLAPPPPAPPAAIPARTPPPLLPLTWLALAAFLVCVIAILMLRHLMQRPLLSFEEHKQLAERLRSGLEPGGVGDV
jgi:flagellar M-ring protein FliF